jgi:uncharacterized protein with ParB-like and HNH nuclease domain
MKIAEMALNRLNRDYFLPSIQREFVWGRNENKIEKLFDSIMQEYPFGSILVWSVNKNPDLEKLTWEVYKFVNDFDEDMPHNPLANLNGIGIVNLILDGQQRLTALNIGLKGSYSFSYRRHKKRTKLYINLVADIENDPDNTYGLKYDFRFLENIPDDSPGLWFEVGKVLDYYDKQTEIFKEDYDEFIREKYDGNREMISKAKTTLGQLHSVICKQDQINEITVDTKDDEKVLNIFVRTNDGGMKLEKADLLLSYMESNRNLFSPNGARKEIHGFVDELNKEEVRKPNFEIYKDDILKACLVISDLEVQYKLKNFNETNLKIINSNWPIIKKSMNLTVKLISKYGFSKNNVISKNALIPIAYYLYKNAMSTSFVYSQSNQDLEIKNEIIRWLVVSQMTGAFGSAADSTLRNVREQLNNNKRFKDITLGKILDEEDIDKWLNKEGYNSKYSHLILMLISPEQYWDDCHQDHIYPRSKFNQKEYEKLNLNELQRKFYNDYADSLMNLHLLNPSVNIVKSDDDFIDWKNEQNRTFIENSLVPMDIDLSFSNFEKFIEKRREKIKDKLIQLLVNR